MTSKPRRLDPMQPQTKFIVEGGDVGQTILKPARFAQKHWQAAGRQRQSVSRVGKNGGNLSVQSLRHSVTNCFQSSRRKPGAASRINNLNRAIENMKPSCDVT